MLGFDIAYTCTKFDHSSFSRFKDMVGSHQNLNGLRDLTTPLGGIFVILRLGLNTINLPTKFDSILYLHSL